METQEYVLLVKNNLDGQQGPAENIRISQTKYISLFYLFHLLLPTFPWNFSHPTIGTEET
uniref:Uncharacterized protein n=1 Tax=Taeniopygia guttata TaxID=59729 RepID=A0A674HNQ2_TAEGU